MDRSVWCREASSFLPSTSAPRLDVAFVLTQAQLVRDGAWLWRGVVRAKPVMVLTSRDLKIPSELAGHVSTLSGEPHAIIDELASRGIRTIYLDGGNTIQRFLRADLVDRMIITRLPILLGDGIPLFGPLDRDVKLEHVAARANPNGLVQSEYRVLRPSAVVQSSPRNYL